MVHTHYLKRLNSWALYALPPGLRYLVSVLIFIAVAGTFKLIEMAMGTETNWFGMIFFVGVLIVQHLLLGRKRPVASGGVLEFISPLGNYFPRGSAVLLNGSTPPDGVVTLKLDNLRYGIRGGKVEAEYVIRRYKQKDGSVLEVDAAFVEGITRGSKAWMDNAPAPDGQYRGGWLTTLIVKNGAVAEKKVQLLPSSKK
ncbi:MAG: hypothetical protein KatS3mg031_2284 [Chitinophagales bacterium]|nr:MAG: hypothetical protein KatS3mg031_2284 [Chitinophagales bacterium]